MKSKRNIFREFTEENFKKVLEDPYFAKNLENVKNKANEFLQSPPPFVSFAAMNEYYTTGTRKPYSDIYWNYTGRLSRFFFMYLWERDEKYIAALTEVIWAICSWESWSNVAHIAEDLPLERRSIYLDLSSTALACQLAMIDYYIGDKFPELLRRKLHQQIQYRCIDSYANNDNYWWMRCNLNWAAVCTANIMSTYFFFAQDEEIEAQLPRMLETLECFMKGFDEDGCCFEGYGYWKYGFSHYLIAASMLRDYTDGKIDLLADPKVHKVAKFQQSVAINDKECIPFSDCSFGFSPEAPMTHFLKSIYSDIEFPSIQMDGACSDIRWLLWANPEYAESEMKLNSVIYRNAQWFIYHCDRYSFASKAGSNGEPHNHNDVGSFVISKSGKTTFTDSGVGAYTRQYFDPETRYDHVVTSSRGHSVPIINGKYQVIGKERSTLTKVSDNEFAYTMQNGYQLPELKSLQRHFVCGESEITLTDTYELNETPTEIVERFISLSEPTVTEKGVVVGDSTLVFDSEVFELSISSEEAIRDTFKTVYFTDLKVKDPKKNFTVSVKFI